MVHRGILEVWLSLLSFQYRRLWIKETWRDNCIIKKGFQRFTNNNWTSHALKGEQKALNAQNTFLATNAGSSVHPLCYCTNLNLTKTQTEALQEAFFSSLWRVKLKEKFTKAFTCVTYDLQLSGNKRSLRDKLLQVELWQSSWALHSPVHIPQNLVLLGSVRLDWTSSSLLTTVISVQKSPVESESASVFSGCSLSTLLTKSLLHADFLPMQ